MRIWRQGACLFAVVGTLILLSAPSSHRQHRRRQAVQTIGRNSAIAHAAVDRNSAITHAATPLDVSSKCVPELITTMVTSARGAESGGGLSSLLQMLANVDADLVAIRDFPADPAALAAAAGAALPSHAASVPQVGAVSVGLFWRRSAFELLEQRRDAGATVAWARLRPTSAPRVACDAPAPLLVVAQQGSGAEPALRAVRSLRDRWSADQAVLLLAPTAADEWRRLLRPLRMADAFSALGVPPEATYPSLGTEPPFQSSAVVLDATMRAVSATVVRTHYDGEPPGEHWPLLVAMRLAGRERTDAPQARGPLAAAPPLRFSAMTLNAWGTNHLAESRRDSLWAFLRSTPADIIGLQETPAELRAVVRDALPHFASALPPPAPPAPPPPKSRKAVPPKPVPDVSVWWREAAFRLVGSGSAPIGEGRSVEWVRLSPRLGPRGDGGGGGADPTLVVATAHLINADAPGEVFTGQSPRRKQVASLLATLRKVCHANEATLVMGDMNDPMHPRWAFRAAGLVDGFTQLGITHPATYPAHPHAEWDVMYPALPLDLLAARGSVHALSAQVVRFGHGARGTAPSDHWPVLSAFELGAARDRSGADLAALSRGTARGPSTASSSEAAPPTSRPLRRSYNPWPGLTGGSQQECSSDAYYTSALPESLEEAPDTRVAGNDYPCPAESVDLRAAAAKPSKLTAAQRKALTDGAAGVCRVCASDAAKVCLGHGERCGGFELSSDRTMATLKRCGAARAACTTGNAVIYKRKHTCPPSPPPPPRKAPRNPLDRRDGRRDGRRDELRRRDRGEGRIRQREALTELLGDKLARSLGDSIGPSLQRLLAARADGPVGRAAVTRRDALVAATEDAFVASGRPGLQTSLLEPLPVALAPSSHATLRPEPRALLNAACADLAPAVAVRPAPSGSLSSQLAARLSPWRWADSPALLTFDPSAVAGSLSTPWGEGRWGSLRRPGLLWGTFAGRSHLFQLGGARLFSHRCGDNETQIVTSSAEEPALERGLEMVLEAVAKGGGAEEEEEDDYDDDDELLLREADDEDDEVEE
jgi:hypothetical protein